MGQLNEQKFHAFIGKMPRDLGGPSACRPQGLDFASDWFDHDLCALAKLSEIVGAAGFSKVRRATEGPFNMILEARI
jgi:hypothetical protein